jgi:hypothetical protein
MRLGRRLHCTADHCRTADALALGKEPAIRGGSRGDPRVSLSFTLPIFRCQGSRSSQPEPCDNFGFEAQE